MKKLKKIVTASLSSLLVFGGVGLKVYTNTSQSSKDVLMLENVEALSGREIKGPYVRSTGRCSSPKEYKRWVSCKSNGKEDCYPSDC